MSVDLTGLTVAVLGGDERERILLEALAECGARVLAVGYTEVPERPNVVRVSSVDEAVRGADALIAPGLTLVFGTLGVVNFAHGALFMLGALSR